MGSNLPGMGMDAGHLHELAKTANAPGWTVKPVRHGIRRKIALFLVGLADAICPDRTVGVYLNGRRLR